MSDFDVAEGYLDQKDGKFYLLNWELPAAPQQEVK